MVANYPWDGTEDRKTHYSRNPDDAAFIHLAKVYAEAHGTMASSVEFHGGITNGAQWYPLWGGMQVSACSMRQLLMPPFIIAVQCLSQGIGLLTCNLRTYCKSVGSDGFEGTSTPFRRQPSTPLGKEQGLNDESHSQGCCSGCRKNSSCSLSSYPLTSMQDWKYLAGECSTLKLPEEELMPSDSLAGLELPSRRLHGADARAESAQVAAAGPAAQAV